MSVLAQIQDAALVPRSLAENEEIVDRGLATFVEVGLALMQIRDERQYREAGFDRFEDYCTDRWEIGRSQAYRLIEAAEVTQVVSPIGDTTPAPPSEAVARELAPVAREDPEKAREVWVEAVAEHGEKPTARQVAETRERVAPPVPASGGPPEPPEVVDAVVVADEPDEPVYDGLTKALLREVADLPGLGNVAHPPHLDHALQRMTVADRDDMTKRIDEGLTRLRRVRAQIKTYEETHHAA